MKNYFAVEGRLYVLTSKQKKEWNKIFLNQEEKHGERLEWIEKNGKYIKVIQCFNY